MNRSKSPRRSAFTLVEVMIVVAILADLVIIALPSFQRSRTVAQNSKFMSDLRIASSAFEIYAAENNKYPPEVSTGVMPAGMQIYLQGMNWTGINSLGGQWDWEYNQNSTTAQVATKLPVSADARMAEIDLKIDNGALSTGSFRSRSSTVYALIIE